jgi:hypothetical protein
MHNESYEIAEGKNIAFRKIFKHLIEEWSKFGGFKQFYNDYKKKNLPANIICCWLSWSINFTIPLRTCP